MRNKIKITESQMKRIIKESVKKVLRESERQNDYDELGTVILVDIDNIEYHIYSELEYLYEKNKYSTIADYLIRWDYGEDYGEYQDNIDKYEDIIYEDHNYILTTIDPIHYNGERAFVLYAKIRHDE